MSLTGTTLATATTAGATNFVLTSATGIANKMLVKIDDEILRVTSVLLSPTIQAVPGYQGTAAVDHRVLAPVAFGVAADFAAVGLGAALTSYGASGAITIPTRNTIAIIDKATAAAMTLAAPGVDQTGLVLEITSNTAAAHTVTATGLFQDGTTTTDVATFAARAGVTIRLIASSGKWNVAAIGNTGVTMS